MIMTISSMQLRNIDEFMYQYNTPHQSEPSAASRFRLIKMQFIAKPATVFLNPLPKLSLPPKTPRIHLPLCLELWKAIFSSIGHFCHYVANEFVVASCWPAGLCPRG
jgi:hypothetical protein